jgi:hypothetical protein
MACEGLETFPVTHFPQLDTAIHRSRREETRIMGEVNRHFMTIESLDAFSTTQIPDLDDIGN